MNDWLVQMLGSGSMESRFLALITLLDQAESIANGLAKEGMLPPELAVKTGEAKQGSIEAFATANQSYTLDKMKERYQL